mmetsp:Transcript_125041/g.312512  ORF Transcript_125041/g.312512 Transcript_125041/m.312512 type:complete len:413 (+) Transcript_125041:49-1287(+)
MAPFGVVFILTVCPVLVVATSQYQVSRRDSSASREGHLGPVMLQTNQVRSTAKLAAVEAGLTPIRSGDAVFLKVARTGHRLTAQKDGTVHAKWDHTGMWQQFVIEKTVGSGMIRSGDVVFLTAWTGMLVTVGDRRSGKLNLTAVHAKWNHRGVWQKLTIEKIGTTGPILAGDAVFLQAWTRARLDADPPDSQGTTQARWDHQADWQRFIIEAKARRSQAMAAQEPGARVLSALAWEHFQLLKQLRAEGFTCPKGAVFEPNPVALKFDCRLWIAAQLHSQDMAAQNYFSHFSRDGLSPSERAEEQGTHANGENIAAGSSTAASTLKQFKNHDSLCQNVMNQSFKVAGVGYGRGGKYGHYWALMFSSSDSDLSDLDTSCYPSDIALVQSEKKEESNVVDEYQKVLAEAWSRLPD